MASRLLSEPSFHRALEAARPPQHPDDENAPYQALLKTNEETWRVITVTPEQLTSHKQKRRKRTIQQTPGKPRDTRQDRVPRSGSHLVGLRRSLFSVSEIPVDPLKILEALADLVRRLTAADALRHETLRDYPPISRLRDRHPPRPETLSDILDHAVLYPPSKHDPWLGALLHQSRHCTLDEELDDILGVLTARQRLVLLRRFHPRRPTTLKTLARQLSVSRERVRGIAPDAATHVEKAMRLAPAPHLRSALIAPERSEEETTTDHLRGLSKVCGTRTSAIWVYVIRTALDKRDHPRKKYKPSAPAPTTPHYAATPAIHRRW